MSPPKKAVPPQRLLEKIEQLPPAGHAFVDALIDELLAGRVPVEKFEKFGKINLKRGHRVTELVLKYYF